MISWILPENVSMVLTFPVQLFQVFWYQQDAMTSQFPTLLDIRAALPNRQDVPGLGNCTSTLAIEAIFGRRTKDD